MATNQLLRKQRCCPRIEEPNARRRRVLSHRRSPPSAFRLFPILEFGRCNESLIPVTPLALRAPECSPLDRESERRSSNASWIPVARLPKSAPASSALMRKSAGNRISDHSCGEANRDLTDAARRSVAASLRAPLRWPCLRGFTAETRWTVDGGLGTQRQCLG
jgi:hypothetical protein